MSLVSTTDTLDRSLFYDAHSVFLNGDILVLATVSLGASIRTFHTLTVWERDVLDVTD